MSVDLIWQFARYLLIFGGAMLVSKGWASEEDVGSIIGALGTVLAVGWGIYVKWNTKAVPTPIINAAATNPAVPTIPVVSAATGVASEPKSKL